MNPDNTTMETPGIYRFPEFFDRLEARGSLRVQDAVESETEVDGLVYHHRGLQVPAHTVMFLLDPETTTESFRVEVAALGPRTAWAEFDRTAAWDVYLLLFDGGAVVTWVSDAEFAAEEAEQFDSKAEAVVTGRFSFGTFFLFGPDWVERETWAETSSAPGLLQVDTGQVLDPSTEEEFHELRAAIPPEFRRNANTDPPDYLGLLDCGLAIEN